MYMYSSNTSNISLYHFIKYMYILVGVYLSHCGLRVLQMYIHVCTCIYMYIHVYHSEVERCLGVPIREVSSLERRAH